MAINSIFQELNLKDKISKQEEQRQNDGFGEYFEGFQVKGVWGVGEEVRAFKY